MNAVGSDGFSRQVTLVSVIIASLGLLTAAVLRGAPALGVAVDRWALALPFCRAVRARRATLAALLRERDRAKGDAVAADPDANDEEGDEKQRWLH